jgi:hypothetical protein
VQYSRLQVERKMKRTNEQTDEERRNEHTGEKRENESILNWYKSSPQHHIFYRLNQELVKVIMFGTNEKKNIEDKICQFVLKNLRKMFH